MRTLRQGRSMKVSKLFPIMFLVAAGLVVGAPGGQAATSPPPSLAGEVFEDPGGSFDASNYACQSNGAGTFTLHAEGTATGPYPGTFVEDLTVSVAAIPNPPDTTSNLTSFHASFTITSAAGTVTGTKDLAAGGGGFAWCAGAAGSGFSFGAFDTQALTYSATIDAGGSSYRDSGTASAQDAEMPNNGTAIFGPFTQTFLASNGVTPTVPPAPTSEAQCKNGGWKNYPQFKKQGECVSYVQSLSKKPRSS